MVYFQMVPRIVYRAFAAMLGVHPQEHLCQIVTTVTVPAMNEVESWEDFDAFIPHGLAGVTAVSAPAIDAESGPIYFSESTLPSWDLEEPTIDGGVLWVNVVPPEDGAIRLTADSDDASYDFEKIDVTCKPGRFINASPPYGINSYDLGGG